VVGRRRRNIVLQLQMITTLDRAGHDVAAAKMVGSLITFDANCPGGASSLPLNGPNSKGPGLNSRNCLILFFQRQRLEAGP
jgi:hypothetical protein